MDACDREVFEKGAVVFVTNTIRSSRMEEWVVAIAKESGQRVDWSSFAGRSVVKALGDLHKVRKAMIHLKKMHDDFLKEALSEIRMHKDDNLESEFQNEYADGIWQYNYKEYDLWSYVCPKCQGRCLPQNHAGWQPD
jgi:hypothetical protein